MEFSASFDPNPWIPPSVDFSLSLLLFIEVDGDALTPVTVSIKKNRAV
jgi:hypothetical protein